MIHIKGTSKEIVKLMTDIAKPDYPIWMLKSLGAGQWAYSRNEVMIELTIVEDSDNETAVC